MATQGDSDSDADDINPFTMLLSDRQNDENGSTTVQEAAGKQEVQLQQHHIRSINSTVVIRQLPSQGLAFQLWPAATTLVTLLDHHRSNPSISHLSSILSAVSDSPRRLNILELGSGTGIVGIAAAATLGANVTVTDLPHVVPNLQFNIEENADVVTLQGGALHVAPLRWGEAEDVELIGREFDLIMASDVVYHDHLYDPLLQTLRMLLLGDGEKKMVFVMAHLKRWKKESAFFNKARKMFDVEIIHVDNPSHGSRVGVSVYCFTGKHKCLKPKLASIDSLNNQSVLAESVSMI